MYSGTEVIFLHQYSKEVFGYCSLVLLVLLIFTLVFHHRSQYYKYLAFGMISLLIILSTSAVLGLSILRMSVAQDYKTVQRSAGLQIYACDKSIKLTEPYAPLSNKIGQDNFRYSEDMIVFRGLITNPFYDATVGQFFDSIGGYISDEQISLPITKYSHSDKELSDNSYKYFQNYIQLGDQYNLLSLIEYAPCDQLSSTINVFVHTYDEYENEYVMSRIDKPELYQISDNQQHPDCIIVEFAKYSLTTDNQCQFMNEVIKK